MRCWKNKKQKLIQISDRTEDDPVAEVVEVEDVDATINQGLQILDLVNLEEWVCSVVRNLVVWITHPHFLRNKIWIG